MSKLVTKHYVDGTVIERYEHEVHDTVYLVNDEGGAPAVRHYKDGKVVFERYQILREGESSWSTRVDLHSSTGPAIAFYDDDGNYQPTSQYHIQGDSIGTYEELSNSGLLDSTGNFTADFAFTLDMCGENKDMIRKYIESMKK